MVDQISGSMGQIEIPEKPKGIKGWIKGKRPSDQTQISNQPPPSPSPSPSPSQKQDVLMSTLRKTDTAIRERSSKKKEEEEEGVATELLPGHHRPRRTSNPASTTFSEYHGTFDVVLDTVSAPHPYPSQFVRTGGTLILVGAPPSPPDPPSHSNPNPNPNPLADSPSFYHPIFPTLDVVFRQITVMGSLIGSQKDLQDCLDFCAKKGVQADVEIVGGADLGDAWARMAKGHVRYRYVVDVQSSIVNPTGILNLPKATLPLPK